MVVTPSQKVLRAELDRAKADAKAAAKAKKAGKEAPAAPPWQDRPAARAGGWRR